MRENQTFLIVWISHHIRNLCDNNTFLFTCNCIDNTHWCKFTQNLFFVHEVWIVDVCVCTWVDVKKTLRCKSWLVRWVMLFNVYFFKDFLLSFLLNYFLLRLFLNFRLVILFQKLRWTYMLLVHICNNWWAKWLFFFFIWIWVWCLWWTILNWVFHQNRLNCWNLFDF